MVHQNIRSLLHKSDIAEAYIEAHNVDVLVLTETHLKATVPDSQIDITGFSLFRRDRLNKGGGGVAIYCRSDLRPRVVEARSNLELLRVDLTVQGRCIHILGVYLPVFDLPDRIRAVDDLEDYLLSLPPQQLRNTIILGDFNINLLLKSPESDHLVSLLGNHGFRQLVLTPTRETALLDHAWIGAYLFHGSVASVVDSVGPKNDHEAISVHLFIHSLYFAIAWPTNAPNGTI